MATGTYTTTIFGDEYGVRANWADAACPVEFLGEDGWHSRQYQVADFRHDWRSALRRELEESIEASGDDPDEFADEIESALESAE